MNNIFRGLLAGWGAAKLGGGCFGTVMVFLLIWFILGQCDGNSRTALNSEVKKTTITIGNVSGVSTGANTIAFSSR